MKTTNKYGFLMPDGEDLVQVSDLNSNMIKLDGILANMGTSGGGTQSDYAMNNPEDPSYIKNREFYTEETSTEYPGKHIVITQDMIDSGFYNGTMFNIPEGPLGLVEGKEYTITLSTLPNPLKITATAGTIGDSTYVQLSNDSPYVNILDNCKISGSGHSITYTADSKNYVLDLDSPAPEMEITISGEGISPTTEVTTVIHKIPSKYLTQPDYDVADTGSPAYIKNRPFYSSIVSGMRYKVKFEDIYLRQAAYIPSIGLIEGESYTVTANGVVYENVKATNIGPDFSLSSDVIGIQLISGSSFEGLLVDKFQITDFNNMGGNVNNQVATIFLRSSIVVGTEISVLGKLSAPSNPQEFSVTKASSLLAYTNSVGLIAGNEYTITIDGTQTYTKTAIDMSTDATFGEYISQNVIGFMLGSNTVLLDRYSLDSSTSGYDGLNNGVIDGGVCSIYGGLVSTETMQTISISGEFAPHSFEYVQKLPEKYLPDSVPKASFHKEIKLMGYNFESQPTYNPSDTSLDTYFKTVEQNHMFYWAKFTNTTSPYEFQLHYFAESNDMLNGSDAPIGGITFTTTDSQFYQNRDTNLEAALVYFTSKPDGSGLDMHYRMLYNFNVDDIEIPNNLQYLDIDLYTTTVAADPLHLEEPSQLYVKSNRSMVLGGSSCTSQGDYKTVIEQVITNSADGRAEVSISPTVSQGDGVYEFSTTGTLDTAAPNDTTAAYLNSLNHNHVRVKIVEGKEYNEALCEGYAIGRMINKCPVENPNSVYNVDLGTTNIGYFNFKGGTPLGLVEGKYYTITQIKGGVRGSVSTYKAENLRNNPEFSNEFSYDCIGLASRNTIFVADSSQYETSTNKFSQSSEGFVFYLPGRMGEDVIIEEICGPGIIGVKPSAAYSRPKYPRYLGQIPLSSRCVSNGLTYASLLQNKYSIPLTVPGDTMILNGEYKTE